MSKTKAALPQVAFGELQSTVGRSGLSHLNHLDALPTCDIVTELLARIHNTNGLHFCNMGDLRTLHTALTNHILDAQTSEAAAEQRRIVASIYRQEVEAKRSAAYATPRRAKKERKQATTLTLKGFAELRGFVDATKVSF